jgi:hypothetical protein
MLQGWASMNQVKNNMHAHMACCTFAAKWTILNLFSYQPNNATSTLIAPDLHGFRRR